MNQSTMSLNKSTNKIEENSMEMLKSRRIYVQGSREDIQVPFKEVTQDMYYCVVGSWFHTQYQI